MSNITILLLISTLIGLAWSRDVLLDDVWEQFKTTHSKKYSIAEEPYRRAIWEMNVDVVRQHNLAYDLGQYTYTLGINEYADLTAKEYSQYLLGARRQLAASRRDNSSRLLFKPSGYGVPDEVDWRKEGFVTPIKNQGQCGSCWAFSSTGALEGQHFKATGKLVSLSEQNLVDCVTENAGCGGGWMDNSFKYVQDNGGLDTEEYYPYQARESGSCTYNPQDKGTTCSGLVDIQKDEQSLKVASAQVGPIAVAIDASHQSFQLYKSGIYVEPDCSSTATDHAVLVIGYGTESGQDYWLVKNSWGTSWGDQGFIKMARNHGDMCGIAAFASYPNVSS